MIIISILIIIINQQNSPQKKDISYSNPNKPSATIESKRNSNSPLQPLFPIHTLFLRLNPSHQQTAEMCVYICKDARQYRRKNMYRCTHEQQQTH